MTTRRFLSDTRGVTVIEFAIVAPVMIALIMGLGDLGYQIYANAILTGAVQKAGRDSTIQGAADNLATIDSKVIDQVGQLMTRPIQSCTSTPTDRPSWCSTRQSYTDFSSMKPEPFKDKNNNGRYDAGECFTDVNGNNQWDADPGVSGQGGANDVALYTVHVTYPRLFPVMTLFGWPSTVTLSAQTLLKNQPYAIQTAPTVKDVCPK